MAGVLRYSMAVRNPDTLEAVALAKGDSVPDWATDLVHADNLEGADGSDDGSSSYGGQKVGDLQDEADKRGLEVEGSGANGNVTKADLVAALEADDAS